MISLSVVAGLSESAGIWGIMRVFMRPSGQLPIPALVYDAYLCAFHFRLSF
jgi:hypothetical protein